jgi:hypothetical protein
MKFFSAIVGSAILACSVSGSPVDQNLAPRAVLAPTDDPFYTAPAGLSKLKPGAIIKTRSIGALNGGIQAKASYQLMYRTTDSLGHPSAAVSTILIPNNANTSRVLSYQFAEDAAWLNCAPSYLLQFGSNPGNIGSNILENDYVKDALNLGWVVSVPDYEGLTSAFTSGLQAGRATLDSVRAALSSGKLTGISPKAEYQLWGYSGGSLASEWAAELQPKYAPELNFKGIAIGGLVPNITSVLFTINKTVFAGLIAGGILGLGSAYPELETYLEEQLIPSKAADFKKGASQCLGADIVQFGNKDMGTYFVDGIDALNNDAAQSVILATGVQGLHGTPRMPVYAYKAVGDEVSPIADSDDLVNKLCSQGARITYVRNSQGEHLTSELNGADGALAFLKDRFNSVPVPSGCNTTTI